MKPPSPSANMEKPAVVSPESTIEIGQCEQRLQRRAKLNFGGEAGEKGAVSSDTLSDHPQERSPPSQVSIVLIPEKERPRRSARLCGTAQRTNDQPQHVVEPSSSSSITATCSSITTVQTTQGERKTGKRKRPVATHSHSKRAKSSPVTESFAPMVTNEIASTSNNRHQATADTCPPHTLILGTHPSVESLKQNQYYGHPMNAFWWIAGDCLGFRRNSGISPSTGKEYKLTAHLRHDNVLSYKEQVQVMAQHGFALWDVVGSCRRPGSLDKDISAESPNDIPAFCEKNPSIRRIVLTNGSSTCALFIKHFMHWMEKSSSDGAFEFVAGNDTVTQSSRLAKVCKRLKTIREDRVPGRTITLVSAISVSPAAACKSYTEKREFWENNIYGPGLELLQQSRSRQLARKRSEC